MTTTPEQRAEAIAQIKDSVEHFETCVLTLHENEAVIDELDAREARIKETESTLAKAWVREAQLTVKVAELEAALRQCVEAMHPYQMDPLADISVVVHRALAAARKVLDK